MSDTTTITPEERTLWASVATARINAVTPERQCEITAQDRLVKALKTLEQAEARAEKAEKELAGADAEIAELRDELEDSRGTEKDAPNILCAIARLVGVYEHSQEIGDDMGEMTLDAVRDLLADKQTAEANVARLNKALETQRNLTASAHATAQAAWGGEIPSPLPGHKPPSEEVMVERFNHLNCPLCCGSGHIDGCDQTSAEAIARLTKMVDWLANKLIDCQPEFTNCAVDCAECRK